MQLSDDLKRYFQEQAEYHWLLGQFYLGAAYQAEAETGARMPIKLNFVETQAIAELAQAMYEFLPASFNKYTWQNVAHEHDVLQFWQGAETKFGLSKKPAISKLLTLTFENEKGKFCPLIVTAVKGGIGYRIGKGNPITREEVDAINAALIKLSFKIPELHDAKFLNSLPRSGNAPAEPAKDTPLKVPDLDDLKKRFLDFLTAENKQRRGYDLEKFLQDLFDRSGLKPHKPFRVNGEQIDGSFDWHREIFLVEARWRKALADTGDLGEFQFKCEKANWTRGLFISIEGFSTEVNRTFSNGRKANILTMDGADLMLILEGYWSLDGALQAKKREVGETNNVIVPLSSLVSSHYQ